MKKITRINNTRRQNFTAAVAVWEFLLTVIFSGYQAAFVTINYSAKRNGFCQLCSLESVLLIRGQFTRCQFITSSFLRNSRDFVDLTFLSGSTYPICWLRCNAISEYMYARWETKYVIQPGRKWFYDSQNKLKW